MAVARLATGDLLVRPPARVTGGLGEPTGAMRSALSRDRESARLWGVLRRGVSVFVRGQASVQSTEVQKDRCCCSAGRDHRELSVLAPQAVVRFDQGAESAGVDEFQLAEIDHNTMSRFGSGGR
jgi:hypothetical protein